MALTNAQLLSLIDDAIQAILTGCQEYYIGSRRVRRADLGQLMKERSILQRKIGRSSRSPISVAKIGRARPTQR